MNIDSRGGLGYTVSWWYIIAPPNGTILLRRLHIQVNFLSLWTLDQISQECLIDKSYLSKLFKRFHHQSPYQFMMKLKMNKAAERLSEPNILVKEVAHEFGFTDPYNFSRAFKNIIGVSPKSVCKLGYRLRSFD